MSLGKSKKVFQRIMPLCMGAALCFSGSASAETSFFEQVPAGDWTYGVMNDLLSDGGIIHHQGTIPEGQVLSRFEMAVILKDAQDSPVLTDKQKEAMAKLQEAYASDIRKVELLGQLERLDNLQEAGGGDAYAGTPVRPQTEERKLTPQDVKDTNDAGKMEAYPDNAKQPTDEAKMPPKKPLLDDKYSFWGFARMRFQTNNYGNGWHRRYNHFNVHLVHQYKINPHWTIVLGNEFQRSMDTINDMEPRHADADLNMQTNIANELLLEGKFKKFDVAIGRMYDIGTYGFGIDSRVNGVQVRVPGKITTTMFHGRVIDWPKENWFAPGPIPGVENKIEERQEYTALKFETKPDDKSTLSWGLYAMTPSPRHFQKDDQKRVLYGYLGYERQLNKHWQLTTVVADSNAHVDHDLIKAERSYWGNSTNYNTSTKPVFYSRLTYGKADIMKPGTWSAYLMYLYQPTLSQFSDTMEFDNMKGWRPGFNYVFGEKMLFEAYATFAKDIDTGERRNDIRGQLNMFF